MATNPEMKYFILEYNTEQGCIHHNYYYKQTSKPNTYGWFSVIEKCTNEIGYLFEMFIDYKSGKNYTKKYLIQEANRFKRFMEEMERLNIEVRYQGEKITTDFIVSDYETA